MTKLHTVLAITAALAANIRNEIESIQGEQDDALLKEIFEPGPQSAIVTGRPPSRVEYSTGHAPNSGIQNHSLGETYPWITRVEGDLNPPIYRAWHCLTGRCGPPRSTSGESHRDAADYAARDALGAAVQCGGHTWADIYYRCGASVADHGRDFIRVKGPLL